MTSQIGNIPDDFPCIACRRRYTENGMVFRGKVARSMHYRDTITTTRKDNNINQGTKGVLWHRENGCYR
ncbi:hypothetical protein OS31_37500 [Dickeya oryzae]